MSFSSHFFPLSCGLRPPVTKPLLWMIVPSSVTASLKPSCQYSRTGGVPEKGLELLATLTSWSLS
jgi:hypothetical protein